MNENDADKIYLLLQLKDSKTLREKGIKIEVENYEKYDVKTLEEYLRMEKEQELAKSYEDLDNLISGEGVEIEYENEENIEEIEEPNEDEIFYEKGESEIPEDTFDKDYNDSNIEIEEQSEENAQNENSLINSNKKINFIEIDAVDKNGKDVKLVLQVTTDEIGAIDVKIAGEIKDKKFIPSEEFRDEISSKLEKSGITKFYTPQTIEKAFLPSTVEELEKMNEDNKFDLNNSKEAFERVNSVNEISKSEYVDGERNESEKDEEELNAVKSEVEEEKEENTNQEKNINSSLNINGNENEEEYESEEKISEEEKDMVEMACEQTGRNAKRVKRVLTIRDPKSVTDTLDGDQLNEVGDKITVLEFKGTAGKEEYALVQGKRVLDKREFDNDIYKLVGKYKQTEGEIKSVSDDVTKVKVENVDGKTEEAKVQSMPSDLNQTQKSDMINEVEKMMAQIKYIKSNDISSFPGNTKGEQCINKFKVIDQLEIQLERTFERYGVVPPKVVKEDAITEHQSSEYEKEKNGNELKELDENRDIAQLTIDELIRELDNEIKRIENDPTKKDVEKSREIENATIEYYILLNKSGITGKTMDDAIEEAKNRANAAVDETDKEELKDGVKKVGSAIGSVAEELVHTVTGNKRQPGGRERGVDDNIDPRTGEPRF